MAKKTLIYESLADMYVRGQFIPKGTTVVHGHDLLKGRTKLFKPFVPTYGEVEDDEPKHEAKPAEKAQAAADQKEVTDEGSGARAKANAEGKYHPEEDPSGAA